MSKSLQNKITGSDLFSRFKRIPEKSFYDYYYFYQYSQEQILKLEFDEYIEIKFNFIEALYNLDKYHLFYKHSEIFLSELLNAPYFKVDYKILYECVLFYKAKALKNEHRNEEALQIYSELFKLDKNNKIYKKKLLLLLFQKEQLNNKNKYGHFVLLLLLSLVSSGIYIFWVSPFDPDYSAEILFLRNTFFVLSILGFVILQFIHFRRAIFRRNRTIRINGEALNNQYTLDS